MDSRWLVGGFLNGGINDIAYTRDQPLSSSNDISYEWIFWSSTMPITTSDPANVRCITETNIVYLMMTNSVKGNRFLSGARGQDLTGTRDIDSNSYGQNLLSYYQWIVHIGSPIDASITEGGHQPLMCLDTRQRNSFQWKNWDSYKFVNSAKLECEGYQFMSFECPNAASSFQVFCFNGDEYTTGGGIECDAVPSLPNSCQNYDMKDCTTGPPDTSVVNSGFEIGMIADGYYLDSAW